MMLKKKEILNDEQILQTFLKKEQNQKLFKNISTAWFIQETLNSKEKKLKSLKFVAVEKRTQNLVQATEFGFVKNV